MGKFMGLRAMVAMVQEVRPRLTPVRVEFDGNALRFVHVPDDGCSAEMPLVVTVVDGVHPEVALANTVTGLRQSWHSEAVEKLRQAESSVAQARDEVEKTKNARDEAAARAAMMKMECL